MSETLTAAEVEAIVRKVLHEELPALMAGMMLAEPVTPEASQTKDGVWIGTKAHPVFLTHAEIASTDVDLSSDDRVSPEPVSDDSLWTISDVQKFLGFGRNHVYEMTKSGKIPSIKVGERIRFIPKDIKAWLATQRAAGGNDEPAKRKHQHEEDTIFRTHVLEMMPGTTSQKHTDLMSSGLSARTVNGVRKYVVAEVEAWLADGRKAAMCNNCGHRHPNPKTGDYGPGGCDYWPIGLDVCPP